MPRQPRDFSKEKVGRLQPLYIDDTKPRGSGKNIYWICECDCGNQISVNSCNLQTAIRQNKDIGCGVCNSKLALDLTNKRFGKLIAIKRADRARAEKTKWLCQCDCGNFTEVFTSNLTSLHTTSCGCASRSIGEENIERILQDNGIFYIKEFSFPELISNKKLRFDFAIFDAQWKLSHLVEFDGRQHFNEYTPWNSKETLEERQNRDKMKDEYCKNNNIRLIRIPYSKRDTITLKDLGVEE